MRKLSLILIIVVLMSGLVCAVPSFNFHQIYGTVKGAYDGATINVKVNGEDYSSLTVTEGKFGYAPLLKVTGANGDKIEFYMGKDLLGKLDLVPGGVSKLDLAKASDQGPRCGDSKCSSKESCKSCSTDCGQCPLDVDNDGVADDVDQIVGVKKDVRLQNMGEIKISIGKRELGVDEQVSQELVGIEVVKIEENNEPVIEFTIDFTTTNLELDAVKIEKQSILEKNGAMLIKGINLKEGETKTIYIDNLQPQIDTVCVKDQEVDSLDEVTVDCDGSGELLLICDGVARRGYTCTDQGRKYKIEGLSFSAVREQVGEPTLYADVPSEEIRITECNDGLDNDADGLSDFPGDPGCSNEFDDDEYNDCISDWECGDWSGCIEGIKSRECTDNNRCNTNKPNEKLDCKADVIAVGQDLSEQDEIAESTAATVDEETEVVAESEGVNAIAIIVSFSILGIVGGMLVFLFLQKHRQTTMGPPIIIQKEEQIVQKTKEQELQESLAREQAKIELEKQRIAVEKEKIAREREKLNKEKTKAAKVQKEIDALKKGEVDDELVEDLNSEDLKDDELLKL